MNLIETLKVGDPKKAMGWVGRRAACSVIKKSTSKEPRRRT